jgi:hypothetical protein
MQGSKPKRLRFVVGTVLLVGAPLMTGCSEEPPMVNAPPLPPTPPPQSPTLEGVGVPLPTSNPVAEPMPTPNTVAQPEATPEPPFVDPTQLGANPGPAAQEGIGEAIGELRANPAPERIIRANPGPAEREPVAE